MTGKCGFRVYQRQYAGVVLAAGSVFWPAAAARAELPAAAKGGEAIAPVLVRLGLAQISEPLGDESCFSPDEPCDLKLLRFVLAAKTRLDVAIYDINLDALVELLADKARQIPVRIVVDARQSRGAHSRVLTLLTAGVAVRYGHQRGIMHNKFIVRDGTMLETGSFNFTNHARLANSENQIYLTNPKIVGRYAARFETLWRRAVPMQGVPLVRF